jgi:hypothetical protein
MRFKSNCRKSILMYLCDISQNEFAKLWVVVSGVVEEEPGAVQPLPGVVQLGLR